ncbi:uncharacterized protein LOC126373950 [Pectinophora gossypiella]|uniref:uncharacterized protein LOC126373950 n=1 Tax=Pectinophora gossypiella TaxID=13191 RepID=UPI00214E2445|nr:uncharacterized protein LOC126373950 [Pectinophora gossypiella]
MERRDVHHCSIAKQTILTTHPSGLQTRVSVELANFDALCVHECKKKMWEGSPFLPRRMLGSTHATPVLGRRSDAVNEGRLSQQCTPVMRRREAASPAGSPLPARRDREEEPCDMDNAVISGWLKFRDNKRWKSRWGVVTKLSPAADCLHLQLYRDPKDRFKKGQTKASLSLQQFLGFESGFTLDKESNTIAIICRDLVVVLAFETRERLIAWQVKVGSQLGSSREFLVLVGGGGGAGGGGGGSRRLAAGPARLHLQGRRFALTSGVPPRLVGLWEIAHLRRYGVVEGRFCFEGGSLCGKGEGLHVLITDQAQEITDAFDLAARGNLTQRSATSRKSTGADKTRPSTRMSDLNTDQSLPDTASGLYEENFFGEDCGRVSPYWMSDERRGSEDPDFGRHDSDIGAKPPWGAADHVTLERCSNCLTKLGVSRSSTVALSPTTHFNPAWTMEAVPESSSDSSSNNTEYLTPRMIRKSLEACQCKDNPPQRPPKPGHFETKKPPALLPSQCACVNENNYPINNPKVGPYENYDVPKATHVEPVDNAEYYDTPKRIKQALAEDLFQVTKSTSPGSLVLQKKCGCILKFGSRKKPVIVECEENLQPVECPCQKVTNWANNLISLPYCKREITSEKVNTEILTTQKSEEMAIYATVDMSRKTNRQSGTVSEKDSTEETLKDSAFTNYQNLEPVHDHDVGPYANYENLEFALSLEYYENAKDLLKKAGVTQNELDALSANVDIASSILPKKPRVCTKCGHAQQHKNQESQKNKSDEYLLMEPSRDVKRDLCRTVAPNPGYTPMSPNPNWSQSLKHPMHKLHKVEIEKSLSIPALSGGNRTQSFDESCSNNNKEAIQKRSSSVDSARLLEDLKEFDSSIGSHATSSSLETLRNMAIENRRSSTPCDNDRECYDCCKSSGSENKTSEESPSKDVPHLRNKLMDNAQIKRSSSVPCKSGGNRDSSSSNDSGVSSCSMKHGGEFNEFEMPLTSGHSRYQYMLHRRMRGNLSGCLHSSLPRKSKSSDPLRDQSMQLYKGAVPAKSSSAEAEVPVLPPKQFKGVLDTHSTSSGTSDMSDYIETLSLTSSHSSSDTQSVMRMGRQPTSTLRPRSGKEYHNLDPGITSLYKTPHDLANYTNLP